ncbi:MAG: hypothetical protein ACK4NC_05060 [Candidatus Gracilibacteria bacterium]
MPEIERKFLVATLPDLSHLHSIEYERYFLYTSSVSEIRIQRKGEIYELERKISQEAFTDEKYKVPLSKDEFEALKVLCAKGLSRTSYIIENIPGASLKIYNMTYEGLIRAEMEFATKEEAELFVPPEWFGKEITSTSLAKDKKLVHLSREQFLAELKSLQ